MPFTLAHPVIVLPLTKRKLPFSSTALITGSVMPDFEFFLKLKEADNIGHHWWGVIPFDLPITLLFCFIFHGIIRKPLIRNSPNWIKKRWSKFYHFDWNERFKNNSLIVIISALIGILSHLLIDGITHHDGFAVDLIPFLNEYIFQLGLPIYQILQLGLSMIGSIYMLTYLIKLPRRSIKYVPPTKYKFYWTTFLLTWAIFAITRFTVFPEYNTTIGVLLALLGTFSYAIVITSIVESWKFSTK